MSMTFKPFKIGCLFLVLTVQCAIGQPWVDMSFNYTQTTVVYGTAVDFAGNMRQLSMDICTPNNDVPPVCGRPVLISIHGGGLLAGTKNDPTPQQWMKDFAKRGYVTASIDYRLGIFQPSNEVHCNVTNLFNIPWDCINAADTSEWIRAIYRSQQDAKGVIRYVLQHTALYGADPNNVFVCGESGGGLVTLAAAFMDTPADKPADAYALPSLLPPHNIYEANCVVPLGLDTSIASMNLTRPDLGPVGGQLNPGGPPFRIRAIGNFFGAVLPTFLTNNSSDIPEGIYMYHQPNDLVVPYGTKKIFSGLSDCLTGLGCAQIINRPIMCGSGGIKQKIDQSASMGNPVPDYWLDGTNNNTDCLGQVLNPGLSGHAIDNYALRTLHMAQYFASFIQCTSDTDSPERKGGLQVFPNPNTGSFTVKGVGDGVERVQLYDVWGGLVLSVPVADQVSIVQIDMPVSAPSGVYFCVFATRSGGLLTEKIYYMR